MNKNSITMLGKSPKAGKNGVKRVWMEYYYYIFSNCYVWLFSLLKQLGMGKEFVVSVGSSFNKSSILGSCHMEISKVQPRKSSGTAVDLLIIACELEDQSGPTSVTSWITMTVQISKHKVVHQQRWPLFVPAFLISVFNKFWVLTNVDKLCLVIYMFI